MTAISELDKGQFLYFHRTPISAMNKILNDNKTIMVSSHFNGCHHQPLHMSMATHAHLNNFSAEMQVHPFAEELAGVEWSYGV